MISGGLTRARCNRDAQTDPGGPGGTCPPRAFGAFDNKKLKINFFFFLVHGFGRVVANWLIDP